MSARAGLFGFRELGHTSEFMKEHVDTGKLFSFSKRTSTPGRELKVRKAIRLAVGSIKLRELDEIGVSCRQKSRFLFHKSSRFNAYAISTEITILREVYS